MVVQPGAQPPLQGRGQKAPPWGPVWFLVPQESVCLSVSPCLGPCKGETQAPAVLRFPWKAATVGVPGKQKAEERAAATWGGRSQAGLTIGVPVGGLG